MSATPVVAIVVAGGAGVRMGLGVPKAFIDMAGRPMVAWSLAALRDSPRVDRVIAVVPAAGLDAAREALGEAWPDVALVPGGATRAESVLAGVEAAGHAGTILVHDAARPLITPTLVERVLDALTEGVDGAIAAAPVADTLKAARDDGSIGATVDRDRLWAAQTPQAFRAGPFAAALRAGAAAGTLGQATDCASVMEPTGAHVVLVPAGVPNTKVTTPDDRLVVAALLRPAGPAHVD